MDADGRFARCAQFVLMKEGWDAYTNDPSDPGGPTKFGVTLVALEAYRGKPCTPLDVQSLAQDEALAIYRKDYWNEVGGDGLPSGVDLMCFDAAINQGARRAARWLQQSLGVAADGEVGPVTLQAAASADPEITLNKLSDARENAYKQAAGWERFGHGWMNRLSACLTQAQAWVGT